MHSNSQHRITFLIIDAYHTIRCDGDDDDDSRFQVPYIEDPNTGVNMFESAEIVKYLLAVYTTEE